MNIGIINQWYPPETGGGGVATYNEALARGLANLGHRVVVVSSTHQAPPRTEIVDGATVIRLPRPHISSRFDRVPFLGGHMRALRTMAYALKLARSLRKIIRQYELNIVEYADIEAEALFHPHRLSVPYVVRLHGPLRLMGGYYRGKEWPFSRALIERMERTAIARADALTSPSIHTADLVSAEYALDRSKIEVIPNPFTRDECRRDLANGEILEVLFVGRLEWRKGADTFAEAIPLVVRSFPRIHFVYLAWDRPRPDGMSMKSALMQQLDSQDVLSYVSFETSSQTDGCFYARLKPDICVVPSRFETFSYPCLEASAHGVPVVASRTSAIPELIEDGITGILVEPGNASELAEAILHLAKDANLRHTMGEAGRQKAYLRYSSDVVAGQTLAVYAKTITSHEHTRP